MQKLRRIFLLDLMRKDKETIQAYKDFLLQLQNKLFNSKAKDIAVVLSLTPASVYLKRNEPQKLSYAQQELLAEKFNVSIDPLNNYIDLLRGIDLRIKRSAWKKKALMVGMGIGETRALMLTRNPLTWHLHEVEKIIDLLITSEEI